MQPVLPQPVALEQVPAKPPPVVAGQGADKPGQKKPGAVGEQLLLEVVQGAVVDRQAPVALALIGRPYPVKKHLLAAEPLVSQEGFVQTAHKADLLALDLSAVVLHGCFAV